MKQICSRRCKKNSGHRKDELIRIKGSVRRDLKFIKGIIGMNTTVPDGEVVENLVTMFKQNKIVQLNSGKSFNSPIETDSLVTFYSDKEAAKTIADYEYVLQEKQNLLDNYIKYLDTACELGKLDKNQIIETVQRNQKTKKVVSQTKDVMV